MSFKTIIIYFTMEKIKDKYIVLLFSLNLFWAPLFFSVSSILGINNYENGAPGYTDGILITGFLSLLVVILNNKTKVFDKSLYTLLFPIFMLFQYMLSPSNSTSNQFFLYYIGFCIPSTFVGVYIARNGGIKHYTRWLDLVMFAITIGLVFAIPTLTASTFITNADISFGGASYQQMAYMAGFAFTLNLTGLLFGDTYDRFQFMKTRGATILCTLLLVVQLISCFYSGGRGGFIYLAVCSGALLFFSKNTKYIYYIALFVLLLYVVSVFLKGSIFADIVSYRMERTFSFISSSGGIDTQNRGEVWDYANKLEGESTIFGTGIFPYYQLFRQRFDQPYVHNFFLEVLIQGGVLYFVFWIIIIIRAIRKLYFEVKSDISNTVLLVLFLYPFITLCFSSTYLQSALLWFMLSYLHSSTISVSKIQDKPIKNLN